ncbi:MAG: hypothetical protein PHY43_05360 [Verrucomicrobiales bacterium]|nr:hypothetical protein [Verrucomicrobiales bacterium]
MKDKPLQDELRELLWRRKLTEAERSELRARPEISADLELESRLSETLAKIPDAPVASNFTTRLMQAVELEESRRSRKWSFSWNWHTLLPRVAVTAAVVLFAGLTFHHYELTSQRTALAKNVALVAGSLPSPGVDALKNFDAIQRMSQPAHADEELLALLQ